MAVPNRKCLACGKEYYFCFKCGQNRNVPAWHIDFCDETCKKVFETISSYNCGSLTKEQANEMIGEVDAEKFKTLKDSLKNKLKEIKPESKSSEKKEYKKPELKEDKEPRYKRFDETPKKSEN